MKNSILLIALFIIYTPLFAQTIQNGVAREINSNRQPVADVFIEFNEAVPTNSDDDGNFRLAFQDKVPGELIFLNDIRKKGYELVNRKDFEVLKISRHDTLLQDVILAKSGYVDAAKREYYNISSKALYDSFEKEKQNLKDKLDEVEITQEQYINDMILLQEQFDIQQENIDALSDKFARINFDDISELHREALTLFKAGEVEVCKKKLESVNLIPRINLRIQERNRIKEAKEELTQQQIANEAGIQEDIQLIQLQTQTHLLSFEYKKAEVLYDRLLLLDSTNLEILQKVADFYREQHLYDKAKQTYPKIIQHPQAEEWHIANAYGHIGDLHTNTGSLPTALEAFTLVAEKYKKLSSDYPKQSFYKANLAISYQYMGNTHSSLDSLQKALEFFEQYNDLEKQLYKDYPENVSFKSGLAISHSKLGDVYKSLDSLEKALQFYEQFNELEKQLYKDYPENVPFKSGLAISYSRLGYTHWSLDSFKKALDFFEQYNKLEKQLYEDYPKNVSFKDGLAISYQYLGITHSSLGNLDDALLFCEQYNQLVKQLYESYPKNVRFKNNLATSYKELGQLYNKLNDVEKAKIYFQKCHDIYEELVRDFPEYVGFKRNYEIVSEILKYL